jgi:hypothetical protein
MNAEERRPTEQLKLRLLPAQAEAIRAAAAAEKKTISDYVYDLHAGRRTPAELLQFDALCEVDRHLAGADLRSANAYNPSSRRKATGRAMPRKFRL